MKNRIFALIATLACLSIAAGCHGQVPPTSHSATLTVTNAPCAAGTPAATCGYVFSVAVVTTSCPSTTGSNYAPLNQSAPVAQPSSGNATYNVPSVAGETVCFIGQTVAGSAVSSPSAAVGPATVLPNLTAPVLAAPTTAEVEQPSQIPPSGEGLVQLAMKIEVK